MSTNPKQEIAKKLTQAYLHKAVEKLEKGELAEAEASYREALSARNVAATRKQIQGDLESFLKDRVASREWPGATSALVMLKNLGIADDNVLQALKDELLLDQARSELEEGHLDEAFGCLGSLSDEARHRCKNVVRTYIQGEARRGKWVSGDAVLKRLVKLLPDDTEAIFWRANWLFMWAKTLFPEDGAEKKPARAKCLGQKLLSIAPNKTPVIDLLVTPATTTAKDTPNLRRYACALLADVFLTQTRICLNHVIEDDAEHFCYGAKHFFSETLDNAEQFFKEALALPFPPERQLLVSLAIDQAHLSLEADQPNQAFTFLNHLKAEVTDKEFEEIRRKVYHFTRLYAGRNHWKTAKQALEAWQEWLAPPAEEKFYILDDLNREWLDFVRARRLPDPGPPPETEIDRQVAEVQVTKEGYLDAQTLKLDNQDRWANDFMQANLMLGQSYLANDKLDKAIRCYQNILNLESHRTEHENQISQSLYSYSERMLNQENWDEALLALKKLEDFDLAAPDRETKPDPRVSGANQRVILEQCRAYLAVDRIDEVFTQLKTLPQPWPVGKIRGIIRNYSQERRQADEWSHAIVALKHLDEFLSSDGRQDHDQQALQLFVDGLAQWGERLKEKGERVQATGKYLQALKLTRQATQRRSYELANSYIEVAMQLAQEQLNDHYLAPQTSTAINEAIEWYQKIVELPEHYKKHEWDIHETLYVHADKLAEANQWEPAYQVLDKLDELHPKPEDNYRTRFAGWRRELTLREVQMWLEQEQLDEAFERLKRLKTWLDEYDAPQANWLDNANQVKTVYKRFYRIWLERPAWDLAIKMSAQLASLLPGDGEVNGWEVRTYYQQGQALFEQNLFQEALDCYKHALAKARKQKAISVSDIQSHALETQLAQARQYLTENNLKEAKRIYEQALKRPGKHPHRSDEIRQALKEYSDSLIDRQTPSDWEWETAHQALIDLVDLGLDSNQVLEWRHRLTLREIEEAILGQRDDVKIAITKIEAMPQPWPLENVKDVFHRYSKSRAKTDSWKRSIEALKSLGAILIKETADPKWVVEELTELGNLLNDQRNFLGSKAAYQTAEEFDVD